jgi:energy-coupling factor transporter ATP-binding protein EcfA2
MDVLHGLMMSDLLQSHPGHPLIHGATIRIGGKRILVAGGKAAGKSTLALHLLSSGHDVEGDEHLLILPHGVVARPRTLRIKPNTLTMIDGLPLSIARSPVYAMWNGTSIHAVNPSLLGRPWRISPGKLDCIVFAEANHGGRSLATPISVDEAFDRLVANTYFLKSGIARMAGRLRSLALDTPAYLLRLGDLASAEWHLRNMARS